jgi:hypothetical protein
LCAGSPTGDAQRVSIRARLAILVGVVVLLAVGVFVLFLFTGGTEILFGRTVPVTFSTIGDQPDSRRVILTGKLDLPAGESLGDDSQLVYLLDPAESGAAVGVSINLPQSGSTPAPNQMAFLPLAYTFDDLRVRLADGSYAGWFDVVRVTGRVHGCTAGGRHLSCIDAELIEAAQ